jgi:hypothetical protein
MTRKYSKSSTYKLTFIILFSIEIGLLFFYIYDSILIYIFKANINIVNDIWNFYLYFILIILLIIIAALYDIYKKIIYSKLKIL